MRMLPAWLMLIVFVVAEVLCRVMVAGASTVPLTKAPVVVAKAPGAGATPVAKTGGPTQNLPKATV